MNFQIVFIYFLVYLNKECLATDKFNEELFVKPFPSGHVNTYFQFTTEWSLNNAENRM